MRPAEAFVDHLAANNADDKDKGILTTDGPPERRGNKLVAEQSAAIDK